MTRASSNHPPDRWQPTRMVKRPLGARKDWTVEAGPSGFNLQRGEYAPGVDPADVVSVYIDLGEIVNILRDGHGQWYPKVRETMKEALDGKP